MNKSEIIKKIAESTGVTQKEANKVLKAFFNAVGEALQKGEKVQFVDFGTFEVKQRAARVGKDLNTGKAVKIAACRMPTFRPGKKLKERIL